MTTTSVEVKMKKSEVSFTSTFVGLSGYPDNCGAFTASPTVELEDRLWSVRIYPGGIDNDSKGFMSCFVVCESPETTRAAFRISVINQKGWKNHHFVSDSVKTFQNYSANCINFWGDPKFLARNALITPSNGICVDDKIIIRVELTIYGTLEQYIRTPNAQYFGSPPRRRSILDDLGHLFTDLSLADVTIVCPARNDSTETTMSIATKSHDLPTIVETSPLTAKGSFDSVEPTKLAMDEDTTAAAAAGTTDNAMVTEDTENTYAGIDAAPVMVRLPAHKFILSLRSPVFKAMFSNQMNEASTHEVFIPDFDAVVMQEFLHFIYTDHCERTVLDTHSEPLLAAACKYQVPGLEALCENHLCSTLSVHNVAGVLYLSDLYCAHQLKARALHYIAHNAKAVVQTDGFFQSLSMPLCQEVIRALAGVETPGQEGAHGHMHVLPSPSSEPSPGKPFAV